MNKNSKQFWKGVKNIKNSGNQEIHEIVGLMSNQKIADRFSNNFRKIFDDKKSQSVIPGDGSDDLLRTYNLGELINIVSVNDVRKACKDLNSGIDFEGLYDSHFKKAPTIVHKITSKLFSSSLLHSVLPNNMLKGIINPTLKDKLNNLTDSNNYRPVIKSSML